MCDTSDIGIIASSIFLYASREVRDLTDCLLEKKMPISRNSKYTCRVISSIFEVTESLDEEWDRVLFSVVGEYSAHRFFR
jgi:hypothetical protein